MKDIVKEVDNRICTELAALLTEEDKDLVELKIDRLRAEIDELKDSLNASITTALMFIDYMEERL